MSITYIDHFLLVFKKTGKKFYSFAQNLKFILFSFGLRVGNLS